MSIETHLATLAHKRAVLKSQIAEEMAHPHPDLGRIAQFKKLNLLLKEEMQDCFRQLRRKASAA